MADFSGPQETREKGCRIWPAPRARSPGSWQDKATRRILLRSYLAHLPMLLWLIPESPQVILLKDTICICRGRRHCGSVIHSTDCHPVKEFQPLIRPWSRIPTSTAHAGRYVSDLGGGLQQCQPAREASGRLGPCEKPAYRAANRNSQSNATKKPSSRKAGSAPGTASSARAARARCLPRPRR